MIDEYRHRWDRPAPAPEPDRPPVLTTLLQALSGLHIGRADLRVDCTSCSRTRQEGQQIWVYAYRAADAPAWVLTRCYCRECANHRIETPTHGMSEALIEARLDVATLTHTQRHELCLSQIDVLTFSPPTEGTQP